MSSSKNIERLLLHWKPFLQDSILKYLDLHFQHSKHVIDKITQESSDLNPFSHQILYALGLDKKNNTGKLLRSSLVFLSHYLENEEYHQALSFASAIEIIHAFTLVHDDIQDNSPLRRGYASVWKQYQANHAINIGDYLFALAFKIIHEPSNTISAEKKSTLSFLLADTIETICEGQYLDMQFEKTESITEKDYFFMISKKTAALIQLSMQSGAFIAKAEDARVQLYSLLGFDLGLFFQIQDDYLDTWGDEQKTGKKKHSDIFQKKKNYPFVLLNNSCSAHSRELLRNIYSKDQLNENDVNTIISLMEKHSIKAKVLSKQEELHHKLLLGIKNLCLNEKEVYLLELIEMIDKRER